MTELNFNIPITLIILGFATFSSYVFLKSEKIPYFIRFLSMPIILIAALSCYKFYDNSLGRAYPAQLPDKVVFLEYNLVFDKSSSIPQSIELWVLEMNGKTRLYLIPFDENFQKQLQKARQETKSGVSVVLEKKPKGSFDKNGGPSKKQVGESEYQIRNLDAESIISK